jgi:hypothetical protein
VCGDRTRVTNVRGWRPRPLDEHDRSVDVRAAGIEPASSGVSSRRSASDLRAHFRAGDANRTRLERFGRPTPHQTATPAEGSRQRRLRRAGSARRQSPRRSSSRTVRSEPRDRTENKWLTATRDAFSPARNKRASPRSRTASAHLQNGYAAANTCEALSSPRRESNSSRRITNALHDRRATRAIEQVTEIESVYPRWQRGASPVGLTCK